MEALIELFWFFIFAVFVIYDFYKKWKIKKILKATAIALNLGTDFGILRRKRQLSGKCDGIGISIKVARKFKQEYFIMKSVHNIVDNTRFKLVTKSWSTNIIGALEFDKYLTSDEWFDKSFLCTTNHPVTLAALLSKPIREKIMGFNTCIDELTINNDQIITKMMISNDDGARTVITILKDMIAISKDFSRPENAKDRLIKNFNTEHHQAVRLRILKLLVSQFQQDDQITSFLKTAITDNSIEIKIEAAKHMGIDGMKHLRTMLKNKSRIAPEQIIEIVKYLGQQKFMASIDVLADLCRNCLDRELHIEILNAFKAFGDPGLNRILLSQLDIHDSQIQIAAIEALGTCGTTESVEKLHSLSQTLNFSLKSAVQKSIAQIQSRSGKTEKGWLSISELKELDGALSKGLDPNDD